MILTATATKATKEEILTTLHLSEKDIHFVEQSPNRSNLKYSVQYIDKNEPLETAFSTLINELKALGLNTPRILIYCQTRKQCAVLYRVFEIFLGKYIFHGECKPQNRIVEMYHAGTPTSVKEQIIENLASDEGHLRVLISTIAFGMGVNCKKVRRVIHFGPSKSVEMYVQECGRAGRDGLASTCVLLYNGLLSAHCEKDMKQYISSSGCRRQWLMNHFGFHGDQSSSGQHSCCDICAFTCVCGNETCPDFWSPHSEKDTIPEMSIGKSLNDTGRQIRVVSSVAKKLLQKKLLELHINLSKQVDVETMVTCPNILLEFNSFHINQIVRNCQLLFSVKDVFEVVEIWRHKYAVAIIQILSDVFGDINTNTEIPTIADEANEDDTILSDWGQLRDDSSLHLMLDTQDLEEFEVSGQSENVNDQDNSQNSDTLVDDSSDVL